MDKKIIIIGFGLFFIIIISLFFINNSSTNINAPIEENIKKNTLISKNSINKPLELKISNKRNVSKKQIKVSDNQNVLVKNEVENYNNSNVIIIGRKKINDFVYNNGLQVISENDNEIIYAKNNPQKNSFAPPMMPVIITYKLNGVKKSIIIPNNIAVSNKKIYVGVEKNGEVQKLIGIPIRPSNSNSTKNKTTKDSIKILTPPAIGQ